MEIASIFNKETGKRPFLIFPGNGHKKGKKVSSKTRILYIQTTTEKIDWLWVDWMSVMRGKNCNLKKGPKVKQYLLKFLSQLP